jgi:hypothetical protein
LKKSKVFISYSHADRQFVDWLTDELAGSDIDVWIDKQNIKVGDSIIGKIAEGISAADFLIVVLSQASVQSRWVREELDAATMRTIEDRHAFVLPVLIEECEIPSLLQHRKYADFTDDSQRAFQELLDVIAGDDAPAVEPVTREEPGPLVDPQRVRADLASALGIPPDQLRIVLKRPGLLLVDMPPEAADRLVAWHTSGSLLIPSLELRAVKITGQVAVPPPSSASSGLPGSHERILAPVNHTFGVSLIGRASQGANQLGLVVENTSAMDFRRVTLQLTPSHSALTLRPTERHFALRGGVSQSFPITLEAVQPGIYEIEVRASSVPPPPDGFLRTRLILRVDPPEFRSVVEIKLI